MKKFFPLLKQVIRQGWRPPRKLTDPIDQQQTSYLELFYDVVYVVLINQLSFGLADNLSVTGIKQFTFLFVIVWWAWLNVTSYHELHGTNDLRTRVATFLEIACVSAMALFARNAMGEGAVGFALSYAAFQFIVMLLWRGTGVHDPAHRPFSRPYVVAFAISTALFIASVFIPTPTRFWLWGVSVLITVLLPVYLVKLTRLHPEMRPQLNLGMRIDQNRAQRLGLFTIIVLGEVITNVVLEVIELFESNHAAAIVAGLGTVILIGIWWLYFELISARLPQQRMLATGIWMYGHLPLTIGIAAVGTSIFNMMETSGQPLSDIQRWLFVISCIVMLLTIILLTETLHEDHRQPTHRMNRNLALIAVVLMIPLGFIPMSALTLLSIIAASFLVLIIGGFLSWMHLLRIGEITLEEVAPTTIEEGAEA